MNGEFYPWGPLLLGNQHPVPTREGKLVQTTGARNSGRGPGPRIRCIIFFIYSRSALAGVPEKIVLPDPIPTLGGPPSIRYTTDERVSRLEFRLLVFWLLTLSVVVVARYSPLIQWPQIPRLHCALATLSVSKTSITGLRLIVFGSYSCFASCLRRS